MGMYTLLYLKWITNKDLLHVELCSMLFVSLDVRGVWGRMNTRMCMAESLPIHLKLSQHCQSAVH